MYGQDVCFDTENLSFLEKIGFPKHVRNKVCSINNFGRERKEIMKSKHLQFSADISHFLAHVSKQQTSFLLPCKGGC